jgi:hypothetical protein
MYPNKYLCRILTFLSETFRNPKMLWIFSIFDIFSLVPNRSQEQIYKSAVAKKFHRTNSAGKNINNILLRLRGFW